MKHKFIRMFILSSLLLGNISFLQPSISKVKAITDVSTELVEDEDWATNAGASKNYIANEEETYIAGLTSYGIHGYYKYKVHLDGLEVSYRAEGLPAQSTSTGIYLSSSPSTYMGFPTISMWKGLYDKQTRVNVGETHNYNNGCYAYSSPDTSSSKTFGLAASMVMSTSTSITHAGFKVKFALYNESWYSMTFYAIYDDSYIWTNMGATYNATDKSCTVYTPVSDLANVLDANGDCYVNYFGFDTNAIQSNFIPYISIKDNNKTSYQNAEITPVQAKLDAYIDKMTSASSVDDFKEALELRNVYLNSLGNLRKHDQYVYETIKLKEADNQVATYASKYAYDDIDSYAQICLDDIDAMNNNSSLVTETNINQFKKDITAFKTSLDTYYNLIDETSQTLFDNYYTTFNNKVDYFNTLSWVITLEDNISQISSSANIGKSIDEIATYIEKDEYREKINTLSDVDKTLINDRIDQAVTNFNNIKDTYRTTLITYYLNELDRLESASLSTNENLSNAIDYLTYIKKRIDITSSDGSLYTSYQDKITTLINARDQYVNQMMNLIDQYYQDGITKLEDYMLVKNAYNSFDFDYFAAKDSTLYADLLAKYQALSDKIKGNSLYYFTSNGVSNVQSCFDGIYFDSPGSFPARLNVNYQLSLEEGVDIVFKVEEYAFYNDGTKANNISINLLADDNAYKSSSNGLTLVIWVFETSCNVKIYNPSDGEIAVFTIDTPKNGEDFHLKVQATPINNDVRYDISVNESSTSLLKSYLSQCGVEMPDKVYFSIGSFLDDKTYPNTFSIVKVNDLVFSYDQEVIIPNNREVNTSKVVLINNLLKMSTSQPLSYLAIIISCSLLGIISILLIRKLVIKEER